MQDSAASLNWSKSEALIHESRRTNEHNEEEVIVVQELLDSYRTPNYITASQESAVGPSVVTHSLRKSVDCPSIYN